MHSYNLVVNITNTSLGLELEYFNPHYQPTDNNQAEYERKPSPWTLSDMAELLSELKMEKLNVVSWIPKFLITIFIEVISQVTM